MIRSTAPRMSSPRRAMVRGGSPSLMLRSSAATATGMLSRKIHDQSAYLRIRPPMSGPAMRNKSATPK